MSRQNKFLFIILCILSVYMTGCGSFGRKYTKTETDKFTLNAVNKKTFSLENISGNITVTKSEDSTIKITAVKEVKVRKKDLQTPLDEIKITLDTVTSTIKISYDVDDYNDGPFSRVRQPEITYTIQVPSFIDLKIDNVHGTISLNNLENNTNIDLITGEINMEHVSGNIRIDMANGDVTGSIDSTKGISIDLLNGDIRFTLNPGVNAKLEAEWAHGKFEYEGLSFTNMDKERERFTGVLGTGTSDIKIDVTNGKIRVFGNGSTTL